MIEWRWRWRVLVMARTWMLGGKEIGGSSEAYRHAHKGLVLLCCHCCSMICRKPNDKEEKKIERREMEWSVEDDGWDEVEEGKKSDGRGSSGQVFVSVKEFAWPQLLSRARQPV